VAPGRGDAQGPPGALLPPDFAEAGAAGLGQQLDLGLGRLDDAAAHQVSHHLRQVRGRPHSQARREGRLLRVCRWDDDVRAARVAQCDDQRQRSGHRPQPPVEGQFAHEAHARHGFRGKGRRGCQDPERDRQVQAGAALAQRRRRQVDRDTALGKALAGRCDRGPDAQRALAHSRFGKSDDVDPRQHRADADLDFDLDSVDPGERGTVYSRQSEPSTGTGD
jgi:hypothetical protein